MPAGNRQIPQIYDKLREPGSTGVHPSFNKANNLWEASFFWSGREFNMQYLDCLFGILAPPKYN